MNRQQKENAGMKPIPFVKYTSFGNNFVILDETVGAILSEAEKSRFAKMATDVCFGIGCDNLLVIQRCQPGVLRSINTEHSYWQGQPSHDDIELIFRMFEPDGTEALACGNGLMSIASYLHRQYGITEARIMTEVPLASPNAITLGTNSISGLSWAKMGKARRAPKSIVSESAVSEFTDQIDAVDSLEIKLRSHDLQPFSDATSLTLTGYLTFTGEPHMVIFPDTDMSEPELANSMFSSADGSTTAEKRRNFGSWLIDHIGSFINKHYADLFPAGVNVNFARVDSRTQSLQYRCFERGINRETLACGTGAMAVSCVVRELDMLATDTVTVYPHRCNWFQPEATLQANKANDGWTLNGKPSFLFDGTFMYVECETDQERLAAPAEENAGDFACDALAPALAFS